VNRIGDAYFDQLVRGGHDERPEDLERVASLGISALRYPVLWERMVDARGEVRSWAWADERLGRLRQAGIRPIVGLVHHGSGPRHTSLVDPGFAEGLAGYAAQVAARYPWLMDYTPVNEPLTTARFSGLYGHWYPHGRDDATFVRALLTQCRAVVLSMSAIRAINPAARLIQTEDICLVRASRSLAYQARFENQRRWLTFDLLSGRVGPAHPLYAYLRQAGATPDELRFFHERPCPPDVVGLNYYLTSDRYLDRRLWRYPGRGSGGNHHHRYVDVEAARACPAGIAGHESLLVEAWRRYRLPVAVTEVHLGGTREEQLRWLVEAWRGAQAARRRGAQVQAVTAWALLGSHDWDSLVTQVRGHYEPGVFDCRGPRPRRTALADAVRALAAGQEPAHPVLGGRPWWRRRGEAPEGQPLLVAGGGGSLGQAFARLCALRGLPCRLLTRAEMDIADAESVRAALRAIRPWAVVNAAGYTRVCRAELEPEVCHRDNTLGPEVLAQACREAGVRLLTFSSHLVFDGRLRTPYQENHPVAPLGVYGRSKAAAEGLVIGHHPEALVVRAGALFGPWDERNFMTRALRTLRRGELVQAPGDSVFSPTYIPDLVNASLDLLVDGERGVWHLATVGESSWAELTRQAAGLAGLAAHLVEPCMGRGLRPAYTALGSERGLLLPPLEDALARFLEEGRRAWSGG
jgi:dTDP-4-dehydrorhamnose reductase